MTPSHLLSYHGRGLDCLQIRVGDVMGLVSQRFGSHGPVRVLEIGCGLGNALFDLHLAFGDRVTLYGLNKHPAHGGAQLRHSILGSDVADEFVHWDYADCGVALPYPSCFFDFVYSQSTLIYVEDKVRCLKEIRRVLRTDGEARIDNFIQYRPYGPRRMPLQYGCWLQVADQSGPLDACRALSSLPGVSVMAHRDRPFVHIQGGTEQSHPWSLIATVQLEDINEEWFGTQSYYLSVT